MNATRRGEVLAGGKREEKRLLLAVLRNESDARGDRVGRSLRFEGLAVKPDGAAGDRIDAEDQAGDFRAACSDQPGKADDLACRTEKFTR